MTNYREILRLHSLGLNKTEIASSCRCARNTVAATLQHAANCGLQWPLPEDEAFDMTDPAHIRAVAERFKAAGLRPLVVEPMPNSVHDHIKRADALCDASIEKVLQMIPLLAENGFTTICMNFMAEIGGLRTTSVYPERGGAHVTGFDLRDVSVDPALSIGADTLWANLQYFLDAVVPQAERYGIRLAIHPDDPPLAKIGNVSRILISRDAM